MCGAETGDWVRPKPHQCGSAKQNVIGGGPWLAGTSERLDPVIVPVRKHSERANEEVTQTNNEMKTSKGNEGDSSDEGFSLFRSF